MPNPILISNPLHIGYVTDFWGSYGKILWLPSGEKILISDSRYTNIAKKCAAQKNILFRERTSDKNFWKNICEEFAITVLEIESEDVSLSQFERMKKEFSEIMLLPASSQIIKQRIKKTEQEKTHMQTAAQIADKALQTTTEHFCVGISEKELAWIFEKTAREIYNAQGLSFDTIVAFAENSAVAHHFPTDKKLEKNMPILIDCGVKYEHYCSDMTRCFWFGEQNTPEYFRWNTTYQLVLSAQKAGIEQMTAGNIIGNAEKKAREILKKEEKFFSHSFGHGVGLEIHEKPWVSQKNNEVFNSGMMVTAEPGLYYDGLFGIRIEDLLMITDEEPVFLSKFRK